jgi:hypothetical protein
MAAQQKNVQLFLDAAKGFGKYLGPFLLLMKNFAPSKKKLLFNFLNSFPKTNQGQTV